MENDVDGQLYEIVARVSDPFKYRKISAKKESAFRNLPNLIYQLPDPRIRLRRPEFPKAIDQNGPGPNRIGVQPINMKSTSRTHDDVITIN